MMRSMLIVIAIFLVAALMRDIMLGRTGEVRVWGARRSERPILFWTYIVGGAVGAIALFGLAMTVPSQ